MSWKDLDLDENKSEIDHKTRKLASLCKTIFICNPEGKELLELLIESYLLKPVCPHDKNSSYGYFREGENNMIRTLKTFSLLHEHLIKNNTES